MRTEFEKNMIYIDDIIHKYRSLDDYVDAVRIYLEDDFFSELEGYYRDNDFEMLKDALKGLYILALEFRIMKLYQALLEVYECVVDEEYKNIQDTIKEVLKYRNEYRELFKCIRQ